MRGVRGRLTVTLVALVALSAAILGLGSYLFVDVSLHERLRSDAEAQARFDLTELAPSRLPSGRAVTGQDVRDSRLLEALRLRSVNAVLVLPDGEVQRSDTSLAGLPDALPAALRAIVAANRLGYAWTSVGGQPALVVAGRMQPAGPDFYFVHDAGSIEAALGQLRLALVFGTVALALLALLAARVIAGGVLAPVQQASRAAERIEAGDLSARVPVASRDEFGAWAERFNRMAAALDETIGRLRASQAQNRRFVADVSHELRTPLTALVAEASILRDELDSLPPAARRPAELLVRDVARLRTLVEELMELSRFDAAAEQLVAAPVDVGRLVAAVAASRAPDAQLSLPAAPLIVETDARRLERIVGNLLDNVREHAPGTAAEIVLGDEGETIVLSVADRGPGVDPQHLAHLFDRFYKADPSRRGGSSGLGLAIAREHAALLGSDLSAANREGGGLVVRLRLPVTERLPIGDPAENDGFDRGRPSEPAQEPVP